MKNKTIYLVGFLVIFCAYFFPTSASAVWFDTDWSNKFSITSDSSLVAENLTNYPAYYDCNDAPAGFWTNAKSDGSDIIITSSSETGTLNHELVAFSTSTQTCELHFDTVSLSSSSDYIFYIYYGNAGASDSSTSDTWSNDYALVNHQSTVNDSTSNGNDGVESGNVTAGNATGKMGLASDFDGTDDFINYASSTSLNISGDFFASFWFNGDDIETTGDGDQLMFVWNRSAQQAPRFQIGTGSSDTNLGISDDPASPHKSEWALSNISNDTWYHVVATRDDTGNHLKLYVDGLERDDNTDSYSRVGEADNSIQLGERQEGSGDFDGTIDETTFGSVYLSGGEVLTWFNNQSSPATFFEAGAEESEGEEPPPSTTTSTLEQLIGDTASQLRTFGSRFTLRQSLGSSDMSVFHTESPITVKGKSSSTLDVASGFIVRCPPGGISINTVGEIDSIATTTDTTTVVLGQTWFEAHSNCLPSTWTHLEFRPSGQETGFVWGSATSTYPNGSAVWYNNFGQQQSQDTNIADTYFHISQAVSSAPGVQIIKPYDDGTVNQSTDGVVSLKNTFGVSTSTWLYKVDVYVGDATTTIISNEIFTPGTENTAYFFLDQTYYSASSIVRTQATTVLNMDVELWDGSETTLYATTTKEFEVVNSFFVNLAMGTTTDAFFVDCSQFGDGGLFSSSTVQRMGCEIKKVVYDFAGLMILPQDWATSLLGSSFEQTKQQFPFSVVYTITDTIGGIAETASSSAEVPPLLLVYPDNTPLTLVVIGTSTLDGLGDVKDIYMDGVTYILWGLLGIMLVKLVI